MFDPLKPHFYLIKLGFTGVNIIFLTFAKNIDCGYQNRLTEASTHNVCFEQEYEKISDFFFWKFSVFGCKIFNIFELACFHNGLHARPA